MTRTGPSVWRVPWSPPGRGLAGTARAGLLDLAGRVAPDPAFQQQLERLARIELGTRRAAAPAAT